MQQGHLIILQETLNKVSSQFGSNISSISSKASQFNGFDIQGLFSITTSFADFGKLLNNPNFSNI